MLSLLFVAVLGLVLLLAYWANSKYSVPDLDDTVSGTRASRRVRLLPLGWALSLFLVVTYLLCVAFDLIFPAYAMHGSWDALLPGFIWLTPASFAVGLG